MGNKQEWFGTRDLREIFGLSESTVYRMIIRKEIPCIKIGNKYKFSKETIQNWLEKGTFNVENSNLDGKRR